MRSCSFIPFIIIVIWTIHSIEVLAQENKLDLTRRLRRDRTRTREGRSRTRRFRPDDEERIDPLENIQNRFKDENQAENVEDGLNGDIPNSLGDDVDSGIDTNQEEDDDELEDEEISDEEEEDDNETEDEETSDEEEEEDKKYEDKESADEEEDPIRSLDDLIQLIAKERFSGFVDDAEDFDCGGSVPRINCDDVIASIFRLTRYAACQLTPFSGNSIDSIARPLQEVIDTCTTENQRKRNLQDNKNAVQQCVRRFDDATYDGEVPIPPNRGRFTGTVSKYGWATDFSETCQVGVVIHSAGGLSVIDGEYSVPTITLRDRFGTIVYEAGATDSSLRLAGLRAASIVACDKPDVVTVVAASVGATNGVFLEFELDLSRFNGRPIFGLRPVRSSPLLPSPSVRVQQLISEDVILYAPLFDNGLIGARETALRLYNWRTARDLGVEIILRPNTTPLDPFTFVWDFQCKEGSLCWVTTTGVNDINPSSLQLTENAVSRLFTFPLSELNPIPASDVRITVLETFIDYGIPFSALSLEPLTESRGLACTLSGFLFFLAAAIRSGIEADSIRLDENGNRRGTFGILNLFELGFRQQCSVCNSGGGCRRVAFEGQKNTNVYVWALKECGNKVFAGTNDQSLFFGNALVEALIISLAEVGCLPPATRVRVFSCIDNPGCQEISNRREGCEISLENTFERIVDNRSGRRLQLAALLVSELFEEEVTVDDFGFDLYSIDKKELLEGSNPVFRPVTTSGFSVLSPADNTDEGLRNLECYAPAGFTPRLVGSTAVFRDQDQTSSTFVLDVTDRCDQTLRSDARPAPASDARPTLARDARPAPAGEPPATLREYLARLRPRVGGFRP